MEILSLSQKQFKKLKKLPLPKGVVNTESEIYILDNKKFNSKEKLLLKKLTVYRRKLYI